MKRQIKTGDRYRDFEATAATAELFQLFTGKNILEELVRQRDILTPAMTADGQLDRAKVDAGIATSTSDILDLYQKLSFVMYIQANTPEQATPGATIRAIKAQMTDDDYLGWLSMFDSTDFAGDFFKEIADLFNSQAKTYTEQKNV